jgi:tRNA (adenine37-N6)-methyltransferase
MAKITYTSIGTIHSPHANVENVPIQPAAAKGIKAYITLNPEYKDGLKDLEGFSHLILLYHFHLVKGFDLEVVPFMDDKAHGIFATRSPKRPNSIGISIVELNSIQDTIIHIENVDIVDGTPLIDIKPFFPYDNQANAKFGWLDTKNIAIENFKSDKRFV